MAQFRAYAVALTSAGSGRGDAHEPGLYYLDLSGSGRGAQATGESHCARITLLLAHWIIPEHRQVLYSVGTIRGGS
jgi:hypothetical protein